MPKLLQQKAIIEAQNVNIHHQTHLPKDSQCIGCTLGKAQRGDMIRGAGKLTIEHALQDHEHVIVFDLKTNMPGGNAFCAQHYNCDDIIEEGSERDVPDIPDLHEDRDTGKRYYSKLIPTKETFDVLNAVHEAREYFGCAQVRVLFHSDRESAVFKTPVWKDYLTRTNSRSLFGLPNESNTNAAGESTVRAISEGGAACLVNSGLADDYWMHAYATFADNLTKNGLPNTVPKVLTFGQLGTIALNLTRLQRGAFVCFLSYDHYSSGGINILVQENGEFKTLVVAARHVIWQDGFAFRRERVGLAESSLLPRDWVAPEYGDLDDGQFPVHPALAPLSAAERRRTTTNVSGELAFETANELLSSVREWDTDNIFEHDPMTGHTPEMKALYLSEVSDPIWISKIEENLFGAKYSNTDELWRDLKIAARNAWLFNQIDSEYYLLGKGFSKRLDDLKNAFGSRLTLKFDDGGADPIAMCISSEAVHVCRKMTKDEVNSEKGAEARRIEVNRLLTLAAADFENPTEQEDLEDGSTVFDLLWVDLWKHIEDTGKDPIAKSRIAVRGDDPRDKHGNIKPRDGDFWSPVANLTSGRAVYAHSEVERNPRIQTDFVSFYMQEEIQEENLNIGVRQLIKYFPDKLKRKYDGMSRPTCRVHKAMYGIDRAGRDAILGLHEHLEDNIGLERTLADPSLFIGRTSEGHVDLYADYSDDILGSASLPNQGAFVSALQQKYKLVVQDNDGETEKFAGLRFDPEVKAFAHPDHVNLFVEQYEKESGKTVRIRKTPIKADLRLSISEREAEPSTTPAPPCVKSAGASANWRARCDRPETSFSYHIPTVRFPRQVGRRGRSGIRPFYWIHERHIRRRFENARWKNTVAQAAFALAY